VPTRIFARVRTVSTTAPQKTGRCAAIVGTPAQTRQTAKSAGSVLPILRPTRQITWVVNATQDIMPRKQLPASILVSTQVAPVSAPPCHALKAPLSPGNPMPAERISQVAGACTVGPSLGTPQQMHTLTDA